MFEWDDAKRKKNLAKHGVDFDLVWDLDWLKSWFRPDVRKDYGELRYVAFAPLDESFIVVSILSVKKTNESSV